MKLFFRVSFAVCLILTCRLSVAKKITAYIHNSTFLSANHPYVETYIDIGGQSLVYTLTANGKFRASVDVTIIYKPEGDTLKKDSALIKYDKYVLHSLELNDTTHIPFDLFDLKRVSLNNGNYNIEVDLTDEDFPKMKTVLSEGIVIKFDTTAAQLSDIVLVDTFKTSTTKTIYTKDGYDIQPRTFNFYPNEKTTLTFYSELYNMQKAIGNDDFLVVYSISKSNDKQVVNDLRGYSKLTASPKSLVLASLDITELPSGNYSLNVEVHDKTNRLLVEKEMFFQRSNKRPVKELSILPELKVNTTTFAQHIPKDSLIYYLKCLVPTAETYEVQYINDALRIHDTSLARQFIYNFWSKRDSANPEKVFKKYMSGVYFTENEFSTNLYHGFETDRGRVYLQYGKPDDRDVREHQSGALPYEVWQYYALPNGQKNVYFIFYNPDEITNNYTLINSTVIGKIQDAQWQTKVFGTFIGGNGLQNINSNMPPGSSGTNLNTPY